ncbi:MAG: hypothetical protein ISP49_18740 [Reyranella sp.]|nr:hypothetical protein [Reyranella sp.]
MAKLYNDKKFQLGEPLATKLRAFLAANYNAAAVDVIRIALEEHINRRLDGDPEIRERYRRALEGLPIVPPPKQDGLRVPSSSGSVPWLGDAEDRRRHASRLS